MARKSQTTPKTNTNLDQEILEAALHDIATLESRLMEIVDLAPATVCWQMLDHTPPKLSALGQADGEGFASVEHAMNTFLDRLVGLRAALTTDTDSVLTPSQRIKRDEIVHNFLEEIRKQYIEDTVY